MATLRNSRRKKKKRKASRPALITIILSEGQINDGRFAAAAATSRGQNLMGKRVQGVPGSLCRVLFIFVIYSVSAVAVEPFRARRDPAAGGHGVASVV